MFRGYLADLISNDVLWVSVATMILAQFLKPFTYWARTRSFDWHHISSTGGLPSSHSALVSAMSTGVGLEYGFNSAAFAVAVVLAMIVTYDAAGVRRQAGEHARALNQVIAELLSGHSLSRIPFQEVLGHSRTEVTAGIVFGIVMMAVWKFGIQPGLL
jgi:acid phosphatase family membrane protein YuiD